jgi:hypothetical protein
MYYYPKKKRRKKKKFSFDYYFYKNLNFYSIYIKFYTYHINKRINYT